MGEDKSERIPALVLSSTMLEDERKADLDHTRMTSSIRKLIRVSGTYTLVSRWINHGVSFGVDTDR